MSKRPTAGTTFTAAAIRIAYFVTILVVLFMIAHALQHIDQSLAHLVTGDAWNAPWVNVIERGPVQ
jgi:ABC-type phosphate transport system permease subunit